jgi:uncharacterized OB-fold protein
VTPDGTPARVEPPIGADSGPYWEATREGRLLVQWCTACDRGVFYPRSLCPSCGAPATTLEWRAASGRATVYAAVVEHRPEAAGAAFAGGDPYCVALVDLEEGVRMLTNVVGCAPESVRCGMPVTVTWEPLSDGRQLALWSPVEGSPVEGSPVEGSPVEGSPAGARSARRGAVP